MQASLAPASPSLAMAANLNAVLHRAQRPDDALTAILGNDVAHHVVDPDDVLDLDPLNATQLDVALPQLVAQQPDTAYTLTDLGRGAYQALRPLVRWSDAWASALSEDGKD